MYYNEYTSHIDGRCNTFWKLFWGFSMNNENLFTIGELAKAIGITRKIILNYEAKGLIKPDKKDGATGNRYYTIDTFTQIRTIRVFQELGLSLDEIREYFNDTSDLQHIISRLTDMRDKLNLTIEKLTERCNTHTVIRELDIEPQTVYLRTYTIGNIADKTKLLRSTALEALQKHGTDTKRRMYFTEFSSASPAEVSFCVSVPPESKGEYIYRLPALKAISLFHHGAYEAIPDARARLIAYARENNIELTGVFRNLYLEGPPQHKDKSKFITQIIAMLK